MRGTRIQNVLRELGQEKVEIILFDDETRIYVANALSPARVQNVHIDLAQRVADVFVPTDMVSLAIGREGQNSRLAARLTGFRINIRDAAQPSEAQDVASPEDAATSDKNARVDESEQPDSDKHQESISAGAPLPDDKTTEVAEG